MSDPNWKLVYSTDTEALYIDATGEHDPQLAVLDEYETKRGTTRYYFYRFDLEKYKIVHVTEDDTTTRYLVPVAYEPTWPHASQYVPWFYGDLKSITESCDHASILEDLCSDDPRKLAHAYNSIGWYHGFHNFDEYPQDWTESEAKEWPDRGRPEIRISTNDDDDGHVTLYCDDVEAARDHQSVLGSSWEISDDTLAYASVMEQTDLVAVLEAEGYEVDSSEWSAPDDQDFAYWSAKQERENGATPEKLREIFGWQSLADVAACRRVQDADRPRDPENPFDDLVSDAYHEACWEAGFVVDHEKWLDEQAAAFDAERDAQMREVEWDNEYYMANKKPE